MKVERDRKSNKGAYAPFIFFEVSKMEAKCSKCRNADMDKMGILDSNDDGTAVRCGVCGNVWLHKGE